MFPQTIFQRRGGYRGPTREHCCSRIPGSDRMPRVLSGSSNGSSQEEHEQNDDQQKCAAANIHYDSFWLLASSRVRTRSVFKHPSATQSVRWRTSSGFRRRQAVSSAASVPLGDEAPLCRHLETDVNTCGRIGKVTWTGAGCNDSSSMIR